MSTRNIYILFFIAILGSHAQTGPAGIGTQEGTSALKLWLDAGTGLYQDQWQQQEAFHMDRVGLWKDLSGNNNHLKAEFDSNMPTYYKEVAELNKQTALRFARSQDPTNQRNYLISQSFIPTSDITIYCVFLPITRGGGNNITPFKSVFLHPNFWYYGSGIVDAGVSGPFNDISMTLCDSSLAVGGGDSLTFTDCTVKTPIAINKVFFGVIQKEGSSGVMSVAANGSYPAIIVSGKQPINSPIRYYIGSTSDTKSDRDNTFFDGYIAQVLVYNKILTPAEKIILENYLSAKYDIPLTQNDLFAMDQPQYGNHDFQLAGIGKSVDGTSQLSAQGESIVKIGNPSDLGFGEYLLWAHNNLALTLDARDVPVGVRQRMLRTWRVDETGEVGTLDLTADVSALVKDRAQTLVLLIDKNNDGQFSDEIFGQGMVPAIEHADNGLFQFKKVDLDKGQRFTFGVLEAPCYADCEATFSPNGDGIADTYFIESSGNTSIYNKYGQLIRKLSNSGYWDGTQTSGEACSPGLYFIVDTSGATPKTVTLIR